MLDSFGLKLLASGNAIEKVSSRGIDISLLASYDGTEIIHHRLSTGTNWAIGPSEGWNGLEFIYILAGEMTGLVEDNNITLQAGDSLSASQLIHDCFFQANEETEFLYITSQPVFYHYSDEVQELKDFTISVEKKDGYTADHCKRIMELSMILGTKMKLSSNQLYHLNMASFLHDIGKIKVPDHILNKPGKLTAEEWLIMKQHPTYGREIIEERNIPYLSEVAKIIEQHHERYDGSGYPKGLRGEEISIAAAIIAVVDSYDAMTTDRVYRKGLSQSDAIAEITKGKFSLYHPEVVEHFLAILEENNKGGEFA